MCLHYIIIWGKSPEIFFLGNFPVKWYGLLFAAAYLGLYPVLKYIFRQEGQPEEDLHSLLTYIMAGVGISARFGHCLFYEFDYYKNHLLEMILPVTFTPKFQFIGYQGLASHGASIGITIAIFLYLKHISFSSFPPIIRSKRKKKVLWLSDRLVILFAMGSAMIRIGNFMNSEIIGKPTHSNYGVLFIRHLKTKLTNLVTGIEDVKINKTTLSHAVQYDSGQPYLEPIKISIYFRYGHERENIKEYVEKRVKKFLVEESHEKEAHIYEKAEQPLQYTLLKNNKGSYVATIETLGILRHPAQLYESFSYMLLSILLYFLWYRKKQLLKDGQLTGIFLIIIFSLRIFYENFKENQIAFEDNMFFNMGQLLSIPWVVVGIIFLIFSFRTKSKEIPNKE